MNVRRFLSAMIAGTLAFTAAAQADIVTIGNANGEVFARDEFDLSSSYPNGYINFGSVEGITSMAGGAGLDVAIGTVFGRPHVRQADDLVNTGVPTTKFTGAANSAVGAITTRPTGDIVIGTDENLVFVRDRTNLLATAPGYSGSDGINFGAPISGLGASSNGDIAIGTTSGLVSVRQGLDLTATASGAATDNVNYGIAVTALAVNANDLVAIGLQNGLVDVRSMSDIAVSNTSVNFGVAITALATLANGDIVIGTANGHVSVRSASDLINGVVSGANFTGGAAITALAVTSNGNIVIGTGDNLVFVRQATDLSQRPSGYVGTDGLNFNAAIGGLAANAVPEPSVLTLLASAALGLLGRRSRK